MGKGTEMSELATGESIASEATEEVSLAAEPERLPFSDQFVFAKTMGDNADLCAQVVERVLGRKVESIRFLNAEHVITSIRKRSVRLDVLLEGDDKVIDIEMQATIGKEELAKRLRFYHSRLDGSLLRKGQKFERLMPVYVIFFCLEDALDGGLPLYTLKTRCIESPDVRFEDGSTSIVVAADMFEREKDPKLAALMRYMLTDDVDESDELTLELSKAVDRAFEDEEWSETVISIKEDIAYRARMARREEHAKDNRRVKEAVAKLAEAGKIDAATAKAVSEGGMDALFEECDVK